VIQTKIRTSNGRAASKTKVVSKVARTSPGTVAGSTGAKAWTAGRSATLI